LTQQRTLSYDETLALAKEAEEAALYRSMQVTLVQQIVRRLAALDAESMQEPPQE
jgi:LPS-assembly lipoprotein